MTTLETITMPYPRPRKRGQNLLYTATGPKAAYCPKESSMNMSGRPAIISITVNGIKNAPENNNKKL